MDAAIEPEDAIVAEMARLIGDSCFGPIPEERIVAAEEELGVEFPRTYRIFLRHFGAAVVYQEIEGLPDTRNSGPEPPFWSNVIDSTLSMRPDRSGHGMDPGYVFLSSDGGDLHYYLDTSRKDARGESPVIEFGGRKFMEVIAADFLDFLRWLDRREAEYQQWRQERGETFTKPQSLPVIKIADLPDLLRRIEESRQDREST